MRDVVIAIQEDIEAGILSFASIARKHNVPISWVNTAWDMLCEQYSDHDRQTNDSWYDDQYELN